MNCYLYQLRFDTSVHFGGSDSALSIHSAEGHFRADTLFSALCHTALQLYGQPGLEILLNLVRSGELLLSDSMPWREDTFYLPKPCYVAKSSRELPAEKRKTIKKLAWIPADRFEEYCTAMRTGELFDAGEVSFGVGFESTRFARPDREEKARYSVGLYHFRENCGLYVLVQLADPARQQWLSSLIAGLGLSGIGGKISSGYGKFTIVGEICLDTCEDDRLRWLRDAQNRDGSRRMLLTTSLPREDELDTAMENADYQLVRRSGFVASDDYSQTPGKKQTQYYLGAGALLRNRFSGDLYCVADNGSHPVYRYSKPLFLGVNL